MVVQLVERRIWDAEVVRAGLTRQTRFLRKLKSWLSFFLQANMDKITKAYISIIDERSSVSRVKHWLDLFECACISANRNVIAYATGKTSSQWPEGTKLHYKDNNERNQMLLARLLKKGYGVTKLHGVYHEAGQPDSTGEKSFLVVNRVGSDGKEDPDFYDVLFSLAEWFNQDSFIYKPKNSDEAF